MKNKTNATHSQCEISENDASNVMIMPFFKNKFSPKRTPTRKASVSLANKDLSPKRIERELGPEVGPIKLRLGEQEATFDSGIWIPQTGKIGGTFRENEKLRKELKKLEEENNLLKIKFELLLDMVSLIFYFYIKVISRSLGRKFTFVFLNIYICVDENLLIDRSTILQLTETTAEVHLHRGELESLRSKSSFGKRTVP